MKIAIDGEDILEIDEIHMKALHWRLISPKEWIKNAIIGQISHARDEMIEKEMKRVQGKEVGMPSSMKKEDLIQWLVTQPNYMTAYEREEALKNNVR